MLGNFVVVITMKLHHAYDPLLKKRSIYHKKTPSLTLSFVNNVHWKVCWILIKEPLPRILASIFQLKQISITTSMIISIINTLWSWLFSFPYEEPAGTIRQPSDRTQRADHGQQLYQIMPHMKGIKQITCINIDAVSLHFIM